MSSTRRVTPTDSKLRDAGPGVHRRQRCSFAAPPHRFPERRSARAIRVAVRPAAQAAGGHTGLSGARLQRDTVSTIGEEKAFNPRLQVKSVEQYVELMNNLKLANPKMMDVAIPANMKVGRIRRSLAPRLGGQRVGRAGLGRSPNVAVIDLREKNRARASRHHSPLAARALSEPAGEHRGRRHAA